MKNLVKKFLEAYAKMSTNSCWILVYHQPQAPRSLIKK